MIFLKYKILKFDDLVDLNHGCFMYKYVNEKLPVSFSNFFDKLNNFERTLSFKIMNIDRKVLKILPTFTLIQVWNKLSLDLKRSTSLNIFKRKLTQRLFSNYQTTCTKRNCYSCQN